MDLRFQPVEVSFLVSEDAFEQIASSIVVLVTGGASRPKPSAHSSRAIGASILLLVAITVGAWSQAQKGANRFPSFTEYPVPGIYRGKPAPPKLLHRGERLFRSKIREGAASGPNFAGHLSIVEWGCGSSCVSIAVVDAETGTVYPGPFAILGYGAALAYADVPENEYEPLSFNLNSRLLIVRGCPEDENCATYFYEWTGSGLRLLRKIPAAPVRH